MNNKKILLGTCVYNPKTRTITHNNGTKNKLSHVPAELLELLYTNKHRYISTEELQRVIWQNKTIENRSIMRCVSTVRKELAETENTPYIENRRNEGYRFVADVQEINNFNLAFLKLPISIVLLLSIALQAYQYVFVPAKPIKPQTLTTMIGQELDGAYGTNIIAFSHKSKDGVNWNLYGKKIGKDRYFTLTNGNFNDRNSAFSPDGKQIAFHRHDGNKSMVMTASLNPESMELEDLKVAYYCLDELLGVSLTWKDNETLYLSYTNSLKDSYQVFEFNLVTKQTLEITNPVNSGAGDYYVSFSQATQKLIYFRLSVDSATEIWLYDPKLKQSKLVTSIPLVLFSLSIIDQGNRIVVRTGNGKLTAINLQNGDDQETVLDANYPTHFLFSINDSTIGYVNGHIRVADIVKANLNGDIETIASSSFHDELPTYANGSGDLIFVSSRSGIDQMWKLEKDGNLYQLSHFDQSYRLAHITVSEDGQYVTYTINNQIHLMDSKGNIVFSSDDSLKYQHPTFSLDGKSLYYSMFHHDTWRIESRRLDNLDVPVNLTRGKIAKPCADGSCLYIVRNEDKNLLIMRDGEVTDSGIDIGRIHYPNQFHITEKYIYYIRRENRENWLMRYNLSNQELAEITPMPSRYFSFDQTNKAFYATSMRESETMLEQSTLR